jgi:RNA polymerase sigma factor (sigma-70 family)
MNLVGDSDADLVAATLAGDEDAFTTLVTRHKKWLYRYIHRYVHDESEAQDVLQESLLAAWRGLKSYDQSRPFDVWLRRVALNKCRDRARRLAVRRILLPWSTPREAAADPAPPIDESLAEAEQFQLARKAIDALPARLRDPLILTAIEERSQAETAEILGLTVKAVEGAVYRAKKQLAGNLKLAQQPTPTRPPLRERRAAPRRQPEPQFCKIDSITW